MWRPLFPTGIGNIQVLEMSAMSFLEIGFFLSNSGKIGGMRVDIKRGVFAEMHGDIRFLILSSAAMQISLAAQLWIIHLFE